MPASFTSQQKLTAALVNAALDALEARLPIRARATSGTSFTANTTFGNLSGLSVPVAANSTYKLRGRLIATGANATHDLKIQFTLPASATISWSCYGMTASQTANPVTVDMGATTGAHVRGTVTGTMTYLIEGFIKTLGTAGTAQLQGAQNTSDPGTLSFDVDSEFSLQLWV